MRLLRISGRTKREIGEDLGLGLWTLTRWLSVRRGREMAEPDRRSEGEDAAGSRSFYRQVYRRLLQSHPATFAIGLRKPCRIQKPGHLITDGSPLFRSKYTPELFAAIER